jgi:hypothetical protein
MIFPGFQKLAEIRTEFDNGGRFTAAGGARFEKNPVRHFAGAAKMLRVRKAIVPPKSTDGLTLVLYKRERRVRGNGIAQLLEFPIDPVLSQGRTERAGIEEYVDVL